MAALASRYEQEAGQKEQQGHAAAAAAAAAAADGGGGGDDGKLLINVQLAGGHTIKVRLAPGEPCSRVAEAVASYAAAHKLMAPDQRVKLEFDGEILRGGETPAQLGMEDDDAVDARIV